MPPETPRDVSRDGRPTRLLHLAPGPPRDTRAHATPCRKSAYARRKTRTPRPGGQGVHSEPAGAPVSRAPVSFTRPSAADRKLRVQSGRVLESQAARRVGFAASVLRPLLAECRSSWRRKEAWVHAGE